MEAPSGVYAAAYYRGLGPDPESSLLQIQVSPALEALAQKVFLLGRGCLCHFELALAVKEKKRERGKPLRGQAKISSDKALYTMQYALSWWQSCLVKQFQVCLELQGGEIRTIEVDKELLAPAAIFMTEFRKLLS
jgi:hypothetical protein